MSPLAAGLTSADLPAGTAGTPTRTRPADLAKGGDTGGDSSGDKRSSLSPVTRQYAHAPSQQVTSWTAQGLLAQTFPEPRWAVPGILPEGVTLLCGAPKMGKSWLALNLCVAIASGGKALGATDVQQGAVLYLALEDTPRRLQKRLVQVLAGAPADILDDFVLAIECPPLPSGGLDRLAAHLEACEKRGKPARLIVIDVFQRVRGPMLPGQSAYDADYAAVRMVKQIADYYGVAIILVHHIRKAASTDFLDAISGTNGLSGASDTIAILKRSRGEADGLLQITGRDVEENEYALRFDSKLGAWQMLGLAAELDVSETRRRILDYVREHSGEGPAAIAIGTGLTKDNVKKTCARMGEAGQLQADGHGHYFIPQPLIEMPDE